MSRAASAAPRTHHLYPLSNIFEDVAAEKWMVDGACVGTRYPEDWFPAVGNRGEITTRAIAVCKACPVAAECLNYAVTFRGLPLDGIWGGTTKPQRKYQVEAFAREHPTPFYRRAIYLTSTSRPYADKKEPRT